MENFLENDLGVFGQRIPKEFSVDLNFIKEQIFFTKFSGSSK